MSHYSESDPETPRDVDWRDIAACAGLDDDTFFPVGATPKAHAQTRHAKAICYGCPVLQMCGQWALQTRQQFGVWGGMSERDRRKVLRRRGVQLLADPDETETAA